MTPRISAKAVIIRDRAILLQECLFDGQRVYLLPGGGQQFGEALSEAVCREVLEETGIHVRADGVLWVREYIPHHQIDGEVAEHRVEVIFRCTPESDGTPAPIAKADGAQIGVHWVPLTDLPHITMWPQTVRHLLISQNDQISEPSAIYLGNCP